MPEHQSIEWKESWRVDRLTEKHSSQPFKPDIANAFFRAGSIESWSRGIERIMSSCRESGPYDPHSITNPEASGSNSPFPPPIWPKPQPIFKMGTVAQTALFDRLSLDLQ
ncbi:MAG: hypothetical protein NTZ94_06325 [Verrucomicrobia bacterium]|nr:hypothetical protein [Verrucomicrobiota bacterium]